MSLHHYLLQLLTISALCILTAHGQVTKTRDLRLSPQDVEATSSKLVNLQCIFDGPADNCYWTKDGHMINETLLQFTGSRPNGDCSIVFEAQISSHGRWQCGLPTTANTEGILSKTAYVKLAGFVDDTRIGGGTGMGQGPLGQPEDFVTEPSNTTVRSGDNTILKCVFKVTAEVHAEHCYWEKGGNLIEVDGKYAFVADRSTGDCSLSITGVNMKMDNGLWQCGIPQTTRRGIKSRQALLSVAVTPKEPKILRDGVEQVSGSDLGVDFSQELNLYCQSAAGNPAADLQWTLNGQELPGTDELVPDMKFLWTARNHLKQTVTEDWRDRELRCTATHPSYDDGQQHSTSVTIRKFQSTQIANIVCANSNDPQRTVTLKDGEKADFYCLADGLPKPEYKWQTRKDNKDQWSKLVDNIQNLTVAGSTPQDIRCTASNNKFASQAYSVHWTIVGDSSNSVTGFNVLATPLIVVCVIFASMKTWM